MLDTLITLGVGAIAGVVLLVMTARFAENVTNWKRAGFSIGMLVAVLVLVGVTAGWNWAGIALIVLAVVWSASPLNGPSNRI